jgi:hypothetical protein
MINRRRHDRASCLARQSLNQLLPRELKIHAPALWKGESGENLMRWTTPDGIDVQSSGR